MSDKPQIIADKIHLNDIKFIKGNLDVPESFDINLNVKGCHWSAEFELGFDYEKKLAKADITLLLNTNSNNIKEAEALFQFCFYFSIDNLYDLASLDAKTGYVLLKAPIHHTIAGICFSTARGIILARLQGTVFSQFILPVINPAQLTDNELSNKKKTKTIEKQKTKRKAS